MNEIEQVKQEALLNHDEIIDAVVSVYPPPETATDEQWQIYTDAVREAIAQAQLEKLLKHKKVRIEADDQELPENPYFETKLIPLSEGYIGYKQAQQDMLKEGWRKVKEE